MFRRRAAALRVLLVAALAAGVFAVPYSGAAHTSSDDGKLIVGIATATEACVGHQVAFAGVNIGGNDWRFTFVQLTDGDACFAADGMVVAGTWNPPHGVSSALGQQCMPGIVVGGSFCLAWVPDSTTDSPLASVHFNASLLAPVGGWASVARVP